MKQINRQKKKQNRIIVSIIFNVENLLDLMSKNSRDIV